VYLIAQIFIGVDFVQVVRCLVHELEFKLPTTDDEFTIGTLHNEVEKCQSHLHENPKCKLVDDSDEK